MSTDNGLPKDLNKLKVAELKDELDNRGLPIDGLKKDRALDPELEGYYETPTDAQKALAQPVPKKKVEDIAPVLQRKAQQKGSNDSADVAMTHDGASDPEPVSQRGDAGEKESKHDTAVGHSMVEGPTEAAQEIDDMAAAKVTQDDLDTMPAALDDEVAAIVAKEEVKATLPPTPSPPPRATPLPSTPPLPAAVDAENGSRKRAASRSSSPEKRRRIAMDVDEDLDLDVDAPSGPGDSADPTEGTYPSGSSRVLYILNLRRPLLIPSLHAHLFTSSTPSSSSAASPFPASSSRPFVDPDCPGVWLGPIKDHAFAAYDSVAAAEEAKARVEGKVWPEDTGAELEVRYMPEEAVQGVVEMQQAAWKAGRQRLTVQISPVGELEDGAVAEGEGQGKGQGRIRVEVLDQKGQPYAMPSAPVDAPSRPKGRQPYTALRALGQAQHQLVRQGGMGMAGMGRGPPAGVGMGADMSIRGRGNMGAPNAMVPRGADSYVPGRNAPAYQHQQQPGSRGPLPAQQRMPMSVPGSGEGDGRLVKAVKRTRAQPALIWREGPSAGDR